MFSIITLSYYVAGGARERRPREGDRGEPGRLDM